MKSLDRITIDPAVMGGNGVHSVECAVTVGTVVGLLADGRSTRKGGQGHLGLERRTVLIPRLLHVLLLHVG